MMARPDWPWTRATRVTPRVERKRPAGRSLIGPGDAAVPGAGCGNAVEQRGVKGDVSLHLLHDLMDVAVQHGHRPEPAQEGERLRAIIRAPAPILAHGPERNVREYDDGLARRPVREVALQPDELLGAEITEPAGLKVLHVVERDEVHALLIEAVPALRPRRA